VTGPRETWWYSPQCMLLFADSALEHCANDGTTPSGDMRKAIDEGRAGAIFALGMAGALGVETWMRLVHPRESAPDIRVMYFDSSGPKGSHRMNVLQVEVATYTRRAPDSLGDFLFRTKLDPKKKAYSANTVILIFVQRGCTPEEIRAAHERVLSKGAHATCYLVGRREGVDYEVVQVVPNLRGPQRVNLDGAFLTDQAPVAEVRRGMSAVTTVSDEPVATANPFLVIG
jgi:hypothetical protein